MYIIDRTIPLFDLAQHIISGEKNFIANCSNLSSLIFNYYKNINWAGFYFSEDDELVLGPFQGLPACIRIKFGRGVCGAAVETKQIQLVDDVNQFPGHIACDSNTKSELVIPIIFNNKCIGVLDIDSPVPNRFTKEISDELSKCIELLLKESEIK